MKLPKINRLDENLTNMIAAGEVVERPSGIVKELVENCIDAKAKHIEIRIVSGGIESIMISDDGEGMDFEDAITAFERHATSKLKEVNDLWSIHTMGFRGEALPSIASVSQVLLRTNNGIESSEVEIHYGELKQHRKCSCMKGTTIEVKNLFQRIPARFKHLKSPQYEFSLISDIVQKFAMSHSEIAFSLFHDGKMIFKTNGNGDLRQIIMQIYGRECAKSAILLDHKDQDYHIGGYIMQPNFNRATKYYMLLYINGRMIRSHRLQKCIVDAFSDYIPKDRYPIAIIHIDMDTQLVDVNVHPNKWEIRLSKEKQLEKLLYEAIAQALKKAFEIVKVEVKKDTTKVETMTLDFNIPKEDQKLLEEVNHSFLNVKDDFKVQDEAVVYDYIKTSQVNEIKEEKPKMVMEEHNHIENKIIEERKEEVKKEVKIVEEVKVEKKRNPSLPELQVIGQFHNNYIIAQGEKGLYIIDQHAAQERYHYEVIREQILNGVVDAQPLLIPITIEVKHSMLSHIEDCNNIFKNLGIQFDSFGEQTLVIRELPIWMTSINEKAFIQDMLDQYEKNQSISIENLRKHAIATMACHSSIRFHRPLSLQEMKQVIIDLGKCEQPFHCPHGRPTLLCISDDDLFTQFERG